MDKVYEISLLMDFYGQLITERQYQILDLHYNNDYSLAEIAELVEISRQGVHDNIKKGKQMLRQFESRLGLVDKYMFQKSALEEAVCELDKLEKNDSDMKPEQRKSLKRVREIIAGMRGMI